MMALLSDGNAVVIITPRHKTVKWEVEGVPGKTCYSGVEEALGGSA